MQDKRQDLALPHMYTSPSLVTRAPWLDPRENLDTFSSTSTCRFQREQTSLYSVLVWREMNGVTLGIFARRVCLDRGDQEPITLFKSKNIEFGPGRSCGGPRGSSNLRASNPRTGESVTLVGVG